VLSRSIRKGSRDEFYSQFIRFEQVPETILSYIRFETSAKRRRRPQQDRVLYHVPTNIYHDRTCRYFGAVHFEVLSREGGRARNSIPVHGTAAYYGSRPLTGIVSDTAVSDFEAVQHSGLIGAPWTRRSAQAQPTALPTHRQCHNAKFGESRVGRAAGTHCIPESAATAGCASGLPGTADVGAKCLTHKPAASEHDLPHRSGTAGRADPCRVRVQGESLNVVASASMLNSLR